MIKFYERGSDVMGRMFRSLRIVGDGFGLTMVAQMG